MIQFSARLVCMAVLGASLWIVFSEESRADTCSFDTWISYEGDSLYRDEAADAYLLVTDHMAIDADGAPNAYHPDDTGLDFNANAGYPHTSWWQDILVTDPDDPSEPYIQPDGPYAGYFISKTALFDARRAMTDIDRWVDATQVPYFVFPNGDFLQISGTGQLGDLGFAVNLETGRSTPFIVADIGPRDARLGEVSMALSEALSGNPGDPRYGSGKPPGNTAYVIFRFSSPRNRSERWPLTNEEIDAKVQLLLEGIGGADHVEACGRSLAPD